MKLSADVLRHSHNLPNLFAPQIQPVGMTAPSDPRQFTNKSFQFLKQSGWNFQQKFWDTPTTSDVNDHEVDHNFETEFWSHNNRVFGYNRPWLLCILERIFLKKKWAIYRIYTHLVYNSATANITGIFIVQICTKMQNLMNQISHISLHLHHNHAAFYSRPWFCTWSTGRPRIWSRLVG